MRAIRFSLRNFYQSQKLGVSQVTKMREVWREGPENAVSEVTRAILVLPKSWTFNSSLDSVIYVRLFPVNFSFCFI